MESAYKKIKLLVSLLIVSATLFGVVAQASTTGKPKHSPPGRKSNKSSPLGFEIGVRMMRHYKNLNLHSTPPRSVLYEAQIAYWPHNIVGLTAIVGKGFSGANSVEYGAGLRVPFFSIVKAADSHAVFGGISIEAAVEYLKYHLPEAIFPDTYKNDVGIARFGGYIDIEFKHSPVFFTLSFLATRFSDNVFMAPGAALSFYF